MGDVVTSMRCTFGWCTEKNHPAIGIANLVGKPGTSTAGCKGQYPLCKFHHNEIVSGSWGSVNMVGWESLPEETYDVQ